MSAQMSLIWIKEEKNTFYTQSPSMTASLDQHSYQSMAKVLGNLIKHGFDSYKGMPSTARFDKI